LLGGMTEFPGSAWDATGDPDGNAAPLPAAYRRVPASVEHGFTHFTLFLTVHVAEAAVRDPPDGCRFVPEAGLADEGLPSLMRKVATAAQAALDAA
jgi:A/G-specific adenine glycosylase